MNLSKCLQAMPRHENLIRVTRHQSVIRVTRSIYRIIKMSSVVILAAVSLHVSAAGFGRKLNIHGQNMPLKQVFDEIKKQTGYIFIVNETLLEKSSPVTIYASGATLTQVLTECMKDQPVTFKIVRKTVYIMEKWVVILMGHKDAPSSIPVKRNTFPLEPPFLPGLDGYVAREHKK